MKAKTKAENETSRPQLGAAVMATAAQETDAEKAVRMRRIVKALVKVYPNASCALEADDDPWRLLVMGRLSAQCTDERVNIVCRELFRCYPNAAALASAPISEIERIIRPCGLFHTKAQNIRDASQMLIEQYSGVLPNSMEELLRFPGVGRKIANLLLGDIYHRPVIVADTHCIRICGRLGMYPESLKDPVRVEALLLPLVPPADSSDFCHRIVQFGRDICTARSPHCETCPLRTLCLHGRGIGAGAGT